MTTGSVTMMGVHVGPAYSRDASCVNLFYPLSSTVTSLYNIVQPTDNLHKSPRVLSLNPKPNVFSVSVSLKDLNPGPAEPEGPTEAFRPGCSHWTHSSGFCVHGSGIEAYQVGFRVWGLVSGIRVQTAWIRGVCIVSLSIWSVDSSWGGKKKAHTFCKMTLSLCTLCRFGLGMFAVAWGRMPDARTCHCICSLPWHPPRDSGCV